MQDSEYRFKFYFNATHSIYLGGEIGQNHPHTWEVILDVKKNSNNFIIFNEVEKACETFLLQYQDVVLNTVPPFTTINPTLENICEYFKEKIQEMLHEKGWKLLSIELSETPSRSYAISIPENMESLKPFYGRESKETLQVDVDRLANEKMRSLEYLNAESLYIDKADKEEIIVPARKKAKASKNTFRKLFPRGRK